MTAGPRGLVEIYRAALGSVRHNRGAMVGSTAIVVGSIAVLGVLARLPLAHDQRWAPSADNDARQVLAALGLYPAGAVLVSVVWLAASVVVSCVGSVAAFRSVSGVSTPLRRAWNDAKPRVVSAFGLGLLDVFIVTAPLVVAAMLSITVAVNTGPSTTRLTTPLLFGIAALAVVAMLPTMVTAGPALVIEKLRPFDALWRGFDLQRRGYWRLLPRVLCTYVIVAVVSTVLGLPFTFAAAGSGLTDPMPSVAGLVVATAGWVLGQVVVLPFLIATNAMLYADQRERVEAG